MKPWVKRSYFLQLATVTDTEAPVKAAVAGSTCLADVAAVACGKIRMQSRLMRCLQAAGLKPDLVLSLLHPSPFSPRANATRESECDSFRKLPRPDLSSASRTALGLEFLSFHSMFLLILSLPRVPFSSSIVTFFPSFLPPQSPPTLVPLHSFFPLGGSLPPDSLRW